MNGIRKVKIIQLFLGQKKINSLTFNQMKSFLRFRVCESISCLGNKSISRGFSSSSSAAAAGKIGSTGNLVKGAGIGRSFVASRSNQKTRQQKIQDRQPRIANFDEFKSALTRRDRVAAWLKFTGTYIGVDYLPLI